MSETPGKRRRWPWWILLATLAVMGAPVAWRYRPLNATERSLVGTWSLGFDCRMTFTEQRRFVEPLYAYSTSGHDEQAHPIPGLNSCGDWSASDGQLTMRHDPDEPIGPWSKRVTEYALRWIRREKKFVRPLLIESADQIWIGEVGMTRIRDGSLLLSKENEPESHPTVPLP